MLASFLQDGASAKGLTWPGERSTPPFWELEALIAQGHDTRTALEIIAARRSEAERQGRNPACDIVSPSVFPLRIPA